MMPIWVAQRPRSPFIAIAPHNMRKSQTIGGGANQPTLPISFS